jgi:acyl carrier protein
MDNEQKLKQIIASVFKIDAASVNNDTSPDTVESWDSLNHLNLVLALEEGFDVSFTEEQTVEILNFELIKISLQEQGVEI